MFKGRKLGEFKGEMPEVFSALPFNSLRVGG